MLYYIDTYVLIDTSIEKEDFEELTIMKDNHVSL